MCVFRPIPWHLVLVRSAPPPPPPPVYAVPGLFGKAVVVSFPPFEAWCGFFVSRQFDDGSAAETVAENNENDDQDTVP